MQPIVAIVGRPNVGKSRLFNRLARRRISIVHDLPGVTRDIVSHEVDGYTLLDTGGFGLAGSDTPKQIVKAVDQQVLFAIEMAHVIMFVIDGHDGLTADDQTIARKLRQSGKRVLVVVNKVDHARHETAVTEAFNLGLGEPQGMSAEHGTGEEELRARLAAVVAKVAASQPPPPPPDMERRLKVCFIGRPNVGKSSIANRVIGGKDRFIVSEVPGTTREAIDLDFDYRSKKGVVWKFSLTDTAGLKKSTKLGSPVEYFSQLRSIEAIERADVVFIVLDAMDGVGAQDKAITGEAVKVNKPLIIVVNKWDLAMQAFKAGEVPDHENEHHYQRAFAEKAERQIFFSPGSPVIFTSALTGYAIEAMLRAARELDARLDRQLPTAQLNKAFIRLTDRTPPPHVGGVRFRAYYVVQTSTRPYRIKVFCNQERHLSDSYRRYLEAGLVEEFDLHGCPVMFTLIGKQMRYRGRE